MKFTLLVATAAAACVPECKDPTPLCFTLSTKATEDGVATDKESCTSKDLCDQMAKSYKDANNKLQTVKCTDAKSEAAAAKKLADAKKESATTGIKVTTAAVISLIAIM